MPASEAITEGMPTVSPPKYCQFRKGAPLPFPVSRCKGTAVCWMAGFPRCKLLPVGWEDIYPEPTWRGTPSLRLRLRTPAIRIANSVSRGPCPGEEYDKDVNHRSSSTACVLPRSYLGYVRSLQTSTGGMDGSKHTVSASVVCRYRRFVTMVNHPGRLSPTLSPGLFRHRTGPPERSIIEFATSISSRLTFPVPLQKRILTRHGQPRAIACQCALETALF